MPIKISNQLKKELPKDETEGIEEFLWTKYKACHLCNKNFNRSTDIIEADHDEPTAEGGKTTRNNLWLAHKKCNAFKRNNPSIFVRPFLQFEAFLESKPVNVKYGECLEFFKINPTQSYLEKKGDTAMLHLPNVNQVQAHIFEESVDTVKTSYCYVEIPRSAIFNDEECQPRVIKPKQVWAIFNDLHINPLYEAPGCRVENLNAKGDIRILMFDGQHKTIACWLLERKSIVVKLYLDLNKTAANQLVNSIQGRIKKLPLSALEQAVKLSDEWKDLFDEYQQNSGEDASEQGFIDYLPATQRNRAKTALKASFVERLIKNEDLEILDYIDGISKIKENEDFLIKEATIKTKIFDRLLYTSPLKNKGQEGADLREREQKNILKLLNFFVTEALEPKATKRNSIEILRVERMTYQASLSYISDLLKRTVRQVCSIDSEEQALMEKEISDPEWSRISSSIKRLVDHPLWTCDLKASKKLKQFEDALLKNQNFTDSFKNLGLTVGYLVNADSLSENWNK